MKFIFTKVICLFLLLFVFNTVFAQAPQKMSYQAVIRNTSGNLIVDTPVGIKIAILQGSTSGTEVFSETHNPTTSSNGLASIEIGAGSPITGTFATINWGLGPFFIKTETDPTGGTNYTISGTSQLLSVPYALYAEKTKFQGRNSIYIQDNISNAQAQAILQEQFGPNTENIYVKNTKGLTNLDLSMVTNLTNLEITDNKDLVSLSTDNLSKCYNSILISGNDLLTQIYLPILQEANNVSLSDYLVSIQLPQFTTGNFTITNCTTLQTFQLPQFTTGNVSIGSNNTLQTFQLPQFTTGNVSIGSNNTLQTFQLPQFTTGNFSINSCSALQTFQLPQFTTGEVSITSCSALQTFQLPQFTTGDVSITSCSALQTFQLPQFTTGNFLIGSNNSLTSFDLPNYVTGNVEIKNSPLLFQVYLPLYNSPNFVIKSCNALQIINLPNVTVLDKLIINTSEDEMNYNGTNEVYYYGGLVTCPNLKHILLPSLVNVVTGFLIKGLNIETLVISSLTSTSIFYISRTKITSLDVPNLVSSTLTKVRYNNFLQSVNFGGLVSANAIYCALNPLLTSINLSSLSSLAGSATNYSYFAYNAFPSSQINAILHQLLSVSPSVPKTVGLDHQTPLAPPTGVGITDKATLISQGNNIATD